jgi:hypothetical protein
MLKLDVNFQFNGSKYYWGTLLQHRKKISNCYYSDINLTKKNNPHILTLNVTELRGGLKGPMNWPAPSQT